MESFDRLIKKFAQKEAEVPAGLSWDEMNIPLPSDKQKDRKYLWYLFTGVFFGVVFSFLLDNFFNQSHKNPQGHNLLTEKSKKFSEESADSDYVLGSIKSSKEQSEQNNNEEFTAIEKSFQRNSKFNNSTTEVNKDVSNELRLVEKEIGEQQKPYILKADKRKSTLKNQAEVYSSSETLAVPTKRIIKNKSTKRNSVLDQTIGIESIIEPNKVDSKRSLISLDDIINLPLGLAVRRDKNSNVPSLSLINESEFMDSRFILNVAVGYNYSFNHYSKGRQAIALNEAESPGNGLSLNLGTRYSIKNNFFFALGFSYQRFKSIFEFSEDLGSIPTAVPFQTILRKRNVYHNNSFEFVGLSYGIGRDFYFSKRLGSQVTVSFLSEMQMKANGRSLDTEASIYNLIDQKFEDRFMLSVLPTLGLFYKTREYKFIGSIGWQQGLMNSRFSNDGSDLRYSPRALSLSFGIERRL